VLEAAVTGTAEYVISGDRHLLELVSFEQIPILPPTRRVLRRNPRRSTLTLSACRVTFTFNPSQDLAYQSR